MEGQAANRRPRSVWRGFWKAPGVVALLVAAVALGASLSASAGTRELALGFADPGLASLNIPKLVAPVNLNDLLVANEPDPPPSSGSGILWAYEASPGVGSRILQYDIISGTEQSQCVPPGSENGRGLAMDPKDGNLWFTFVTGFTAAVAFAGDHQIHKTNPPLPNPPAGYVPCSLVFSLNYDQRIQDDLGALDIDPDSKHIWAAGYKPLCSTALDLTGNCPGTLESFFYKINRNNGNLLASCWIPFRGGNGVGNDTLAAARLNGLPGSGRYLLTDAGEGATVPNTLAAIDISQCHQGQQVTPVAEFLKQHDMTGIDFEWPGLLNTDTTFIYNNGDQPFQTLQSPPPGGVMSAGDSNALEDLGLCGFRATFGGRGNDMCPFSELGQEQCDNGRDTNGDGDVSDDGSNHRHFSHDACDSDQSKEHVDYRDDNSGTNFHATRIDAVTHDPATNAITITGLGQNVDHLVTFTVVVVPSNIVGVSPSFSIALSDGYSLPAHALMSGSIIG